MKKQYTKRQIQEAIAYWKKRLKAMNEDGPSAGNDPSKYVDALRDACRNSSMPASESGVDEMMNCQPPVTEAEFREMYEDDPSMQLESDDGDSPYDVAMELFSGGCKFVGFVDNPHSDLFSLLLDYTNERPEFVVAVNLMFDRDETLIIGFYPLGSYNVTSLWYKPVYRTDVVKAASEADARRQIEDQYERNQKSRSESDEIFEGVSDVKPAT